MMTAEPLRLEKAYNVRDLGYYTNQYGEKLRTGRFLRSDSLHLATDEDERLLVNYGVKVIVDLRSPMEVQKEPFLIQKHQEIDYYAIPLFDNIQSNDGSKPLPDSLHELYIFLLDNSKKQIKQVLQCFLRHEEGCCLFNCTAGKDRTGIIAMLLLGLADVEEEFIVEDYCVSARYMESVFTAQKEALLKAGCDDYQKFTFLLESPREEMEKTIQYLQNNYTGISGYVRRLLSAEECDRLRRSLVS